MLILRVICGVVLTVAAVGFVATTAEEIGFSSDAALWVAALTLAAGVAALSPSKA